MPLLCLLFTLSAIPKDIHHFPCHLNSLYTDTLKSVSENAIFKMYEAQQGLNWFSL